jgi:phytoene dehydrogenase-like protein
MRVVIIGAGLAGLACAVTLQSAGHEIVLLESGTRVGGRIGSVRHPDGFVIDRGFQVLFTHYPAVRRLVDLAALELKHFPKGAMVRHEHRFFELSSPFDRPLDFWKSLFTPFLSPKDVLIVAQLSLDVAGKSEKDLTQGPLIGSTESYMRALGFSDGALERFFRPFFGGVFLDKQLRTDARIFRFYWKMMVVGSVAVPLAGMQALPDQLAGRLAAGVLRLGSHVTELIRQEGVVCGARLNSGEEVLADGVVLATAYPELKRLGGLLTEFEGNATTTFYFASDRPISNAPLILLNGASDGLINQVVPLTNVNPAYAPAGLHLLGVQVLGDRPESPESLEALVRAELSAWFPDHKPAAWQLVEAVESRFGQFSEEPAVMAALPSVRLAERLYLASELTTQSSIEGALAGGEKAARALIAECG